MMRKIVPYHDVIMLHLTANYFIRFQARLVYLFIAQSIRVHQRKLRNEYNKSHQEHMITGRINRTTASIFTDAD